MATIKLMRINMACFEISLQAKLSRQTCQRRFAFLNRSVFTFQNTVVRCAFVRENGISSRRRHGRLCRIFCFRFTIGVISVNLRLNRKLQIANKMSPRLRTLLILGRVSNLPTVWSNCLAGWWLSGGENFWKLPFLFLGVSALYIGGMFLNDAFDTDFDRQRRPSRPIPSGAISIESVWAFGWTWLALGILLLIFCGKTAGALAVVLTICILIYNAAHKAITASPWLMGLCRFWVYVIAGSAGANGLGGNSIWCGFALALYIAGLSFVAQRKSFRGEVPLWPLLLLAAPIFLAMLMNAGDARKAAMLLSLVLVLWVARCGRAIFLPLGEVNVGRTVSGLLAGIVFVDWLAVAPQLSHPLSFAVFVPLFGATLWLQRFVPAT
jgi:4-hydroxybenzoate polyprenyltransferase